MLAVMRLERTPLQIKRPTQHVLSTVILHDRWYRYYIDSIGLHIDRIIVLRSIR